MVTKTDFIWMDGRLVPWERANVHVLSHTLHYGFGIFEGIRSYPQDEGGAAVFRLPEHCERLIKTARMVGLTLPWNADFIRRAVVHTLEANRLTDAYIRPLVYLGPGSMDTTSTRSPIHLSIAAWPWGKYLGAEGVKNGIRCCISTITRLGGRSHMVKGKIVGHYVNSILAKDEAYRLGFDEALMMDHEGNVVEGSAENLFIVRDGALITPPLDSDILGGITRQSTIALAKDLGLEVQERLFKRDSLYLADEVILTGTAAEVTPVREIDGRVIGNGTPGDVTRALQGAFDDAIHGRRHAEWLTAFGAPARQKTAEAA